MMHGAVCRRKQAGRWGARAAEGLKSLTSEPMELIEGDFAASDCVGTLAKEGIWGNHFYNLIPE